MKRLVLVVCFVALGLAGCEQIIDALADLTSCVTSLAGGDVGKVCTCGLLGQDSYIVDGVVYACDDDRLIDYLDDPFGEFGDTIPGWSEPQIVSDCYGSYYRVYSSFSTTGSGVYWLALERQGQQVAYSFGVTVQAGTYQGMFIYFPLGELDVDSDEYTISSYLSAMPSDVGNPKRSLTRELDVAYHTFPEQQVAKIKSAPRTKRLRQTKSVSELCMYVGQTTSFAARVGTDGKLHIYQGRRLPYDESPVWSVSGDIPGAGVITDEGIFTALEPAYSFGDCFVIATDYMGRVDSVNVTIHEACIFDPVVTVDDVTESDGNCIFISSAPRMPEIVAHVPYDALDPQDVDWTFIVRYTRSGRDDADTLRTTIRYTDSWNITEALSGAFRGGQAIIQCKPQLLGCSSFVSLWIRGYNPTEEHAESFIVDSAGTSLWYWKYVAIHEGGAQFGRTYLQFNEDVAQLNCNMDDISYTPNASSNGDGGFGMYQLTNFGSKRPPNAQELWDWKENVLSGTGWLHTLQLASNSYMAVARQSSNFTPVQDTTIYNVTFSDNSDTPVEHAVALKRYNGATHDFVEWLPFEGKWRFYPYQAYQRFVNGQWVYDTNYYVTDICSHVE